jgi:hypothetical protein
MAPEEIAALAAQVNQLDRETVRRVARLVLECNASLQLALSAVQEANRSVGTEDMQRACTRRTFARDRFAFGTR